MADILMDNQSVPTLPAASKSIVYADATTKKLAAMDDAGKVFGGLSRNWSVASQGPGFATDTYITNSGLLIPSCGMQAGMAFRWWVTWSKTAAGVATPILIVRTGANQTTADTARVTLTGQAATAAVSGGVMLVTCFVRSVSASGVLVASFGFAAGVLGPGGGIDGVGATFDNSAMAGLYVGLSLNAGASAAWTVSSVNGELVG